MQLIGMRTRLTFGGGMRPPTLHPGFELRSDGHAQPRIQAGDLPDRIGLHCTEINVVEPILSAAGAEVQRPLHAQRPMFDVELTDISTVDLITERPDDVGI